MFSDDDWVHPSVMCLLVGCCFTFGFVNDGARQCCRLLYECPEIYTFVIVQFWVVLVEVLVS